MCENRGVYDRRTLWQPYTRKWYDDDAAQAAFLLGGIGTGNVSVGVRGQLMDWELFNRPGKGTVIPYSFAAIRVQTGEKTHCKVLEARLKPPHNRSHGYSFGELGGLPRFESAKMSAEYPFVEVVLQDGGVDTGVKLEAFTPFIPLDAQNSGIPCAVLRYHIDNPTQETQQVSVMLSLSNMAGFDGLDEWGNVLTAGDARCVYRQDGARKGLYFHTRSLSEQDRRYGNLALVTTDDGVSYQNEWLAGAWNDGIADLWDDFCQDGSLRASPSGDTGQSALSSREVKAGSLCLQKTLAPGEKKTFSFLLTWYFPNRVNAWYDKDAGQDGRPDTVRNFYAGQFRDAWDVAAYTTEHLDRLESLSRMFTEAFYSSTLPGYVLEAAANNITVLRSTTCFRLWDGTFLGWEGCFDTAGSCWGSCTHVWNYAQTLAFLFPELERTMRRVEFTLETDQAGKMAFRTNRVFGLQPWDFLPAADGQMGTIVRLYRDWKLCGDDDFLRELWPNAQKALEFAFGYWDKDGDDVMETQQHNTYDIEFYGVNSMTNSLFFAALKAGAAMAEHLGDTQAARRYREAWRRGGDRMDALCWQGEYYIQKLEDKDEYRYQYGEGCLSDQLIGQWLAHVAGLGYVLPEEHVKKAVYAIYKYNFRTDLSEHMSIGRTYALNGEKGLALCTWPHGGRPKIPFVYCDEVWTGIEYQVAAHLIYEGFIDEGLTLVKAVRQRHDGRSRNPWNEVECGNHYARSMAGWSVLTALSGFRYEPGGEEVYFPVRRDDFVTFWSTGRGWGVYRQKTDPQTGAVSRELQTLFGSEARLCEDTLTAGGQADPEAR